MPLSPLRVFPRSLALGAALAVGCQFPPLGPHPERDARLAEIAPDVQSADTPVDSEPLDRGPDPEAVEAIEGEPAVQPDTVTAQTQSEEEFTPILDDPLIADQELEDPTHEFGIDSLAPLDGPHEVGWHPDDELSVTALERFSDLLPQVQRIAETPASRQVRYLSVEDVIRLTLENDPELEQAGFSPVIAAEEVTRQRGSIFDTVLSVSGRISEGTSPTSSSLDGAAVSIRTTRAIDAGLSQRLATGGVVDLSWGLTRSGTNSQFSNLNPAYSTDIGLSLRQPLLRGFGPVITRAPITQAELSRRAAEANYRDTLIDTLALAQNSYWDLYFTIQTADVVLIALEQARVVLNNNRIRLDVGDMTRAEVLQAESSVAQREGDYLSALRAIQDAEDTLYTLIDRTGSSRQWNRAIVPTDSPPIETMPLSEEQLVTLANELRPDIEAALLDLRRLEISQRVAENALLPSLSFDASLNYAGLGPGPQSATDSLRTFEFDSWALGLTLEYPLQNRAARAGLRQSELRLEQAEVGLEALRLRTLSEVRAALRRLQNSLDLLAAREAEVRARELELQDEIRRFDVGLSTTEILLRFQNDLASARINVLSAIVEYVQAMIELDRVTGRLLDRVGVTVEPAERVL